MTVPTATFVRVPTLRRRPHDRHRKTQGQVVRYSFSVGLSHSLLHAGLSRRSDTRRWPRSPRLLRFPVVRCKADPFSRWLGGKFQIVDFFSQNVYHRCVLILVSFQLLKPSGQILVA